VIHEEAVAKALGKIYGLDHKIAQAWPGRYEKVACLVALLGVLGYEFLVGG
jgi:hypothetical protein